MSLETRKREEGGRKSKREREREINKEDKVLCRERKKMEKLFNIFFQNSFFMQFVFATLAALVS